MIRARSLLVACVLIGGVLPAQAWLTYVPRDVGTGARLGRGANVGNGDDDTQLAIICLADGLTATFLTGIELSSDRAAAKFPTTLSLAEPGGEYVAFPVVPEAMVRGEASQLRLRFSAEDAMALAEFVLTAPDGIAVRYGSESDMLVETAYGADSAAISIGAVLGECEGR